MKKTILEQTNTWYDSPEAMVLDTSARMAQYQGNLELTTTMIAWPWHIMSPSRYLYRVIITRYDNEEEE